MVEEYKKELELLAIKLHEIDAVQFGDFSTKSGSTSPINFDLRMTISHPDLMVMLSNLLVKFVEEKNINHKLICGVPYTTLPIATLVSVKQNKPVVFRRIESVSVNGKGLVGGKFSVGDSCLIIDDMITSGSGILETATVLRSSGIVVTDSIVVIDFEKDGAEKITNKDINVHSLFKIIDFLSILKEANRIDAACVETVTKYILDGELDSSSQWKSLLRIVTNENVGLKEKNEVSKVNQANLEKEKNDVKKFNMMLLQKFKKPLKIADEYEPKVKKFEEHLEQLKNENKSQKTRIVELDNENKSQKTRIVELENELKQIKSNYDKLKSLLAQIQELCTSEIQY